MKALPNVATSIRKDLPEVIEAFESLRPVYAQRPFKMDLEEVIRRLEPFRVTHVERMRALLAESFPDVLARVERFLAAAGPAEAVEWREFRIIRVPRIAKAAAGQILVWSHEATLERLGRPLCLGALNLTDSNRREDPFHFARLAPLEGTLSCEQCGASGAAWFGSPDGLGGYGFRCGSCEHCCGHDRENRRLWCPCEGCLPSREPSRLRFQRELWPRARARVEEVLLDQVRNASPSTAIEAPSARQMERDWKLNRTALTHRELELLELRPESPDELFRKLIPDFEEARSGQGRPRKVNRGTLVDDLVKHKVLYPVVTVDEPADGAALLEQYLASGPGQMLLLKDGRKEGLHFGEIHKLGREAIRILADGQDLEFWRGLENPFSVAGTRTFVDRCEPAPARMVYPPELAPVAHEAEGWRVEWWLDTSGLWSPRIRSASRYTPTSHEGYVLNPFAVVPGKVGSSIRVPDLDPIPGLRTSLIDSPAEAATVRQLRAERKDDLVMLQVHLRHAINLEALRSRMGDKAVDYLKTCRVDIGVADIETGELLLVVEVQAGRHHDLPGWEQKDRWKREACALAGIEFREVN